MKYYKITGLDEGVPITPFVTTEQGLDDALNCYGDACRYYEPISKEEYDALNKKAELENMMAIMRDDAVKAAGFKFKLHLKDGSVRFGTYADITEDPLKQHRAEYADKTFIKYYDKRDKNMAVYMPLNQIDHIEWLDLGA